MKKLNSFYDNRGALWVACTECQRGYNGAQDCGCGWNVKKFAGQGCFAGEIFPDVKLDLKKTDLEAKGGKDGSNK